MRKRSLAAALIGILCVSAEGLAQGSGFGMGFKGGYVDIGGADLAAVQGGFGLDLDLRYRLETGFPGFIGLFPRVLGQFVREEKLMTVEEAVRKMTSLAVQRVGITDRGVIRPGVWADLTVFDKDTIALRSADADPERLESFYPVGIDCVVVNGQVAMEGHRYTGVRAGQVLRK